MAWGEASTDYCSEARLSSIAQWRSGLQLATAGGIICGYAHYSKRLMILRLLGSKSGTTDPVNFDVLEKLADALDVHPSALIVRRRK